MLERSDQRLWVERLARLPLSGALRLPTSTLRICVLGECLDEIFHNEVFAAEGIEGEDLSVSGCRDGGSSRGEYGGCFGVLRSERHDGRSPLISVGESYCSSRCR